jgi:small subunit ribosomal protein S9
MTATKPTTKPAKTVKKPAAPRAAAHKKPAAQKPDKAELDMPEVTKEVETVVDHSPKQHLAKDRYIFATGRRKTAIANVRMFEGKGDMVVNKKPIKQYFGYSLHMEEITKPFEVTGLGGKYYFTAHINGGGSHAQVGALRHGIAIALSKLSEDVRKVLKKNGFLTRDDRKKERKKPGLKRARRSPQWAKR